MIDAARADRVGQRADDLGRPAEEAGGDLGLLEDLVAKTHDGDGGRQRKATGRRPGASASPARTAASASSEAGRIE